MEISKKTTGIILLPTNNFGGWNSTTETRHSSGIPGDAPMAWSADRFQKLGEGGSVQVAKERMLFGMFFFFVCFFVSVSRADMGER